MMGLAHMCWVVAIYRESALKFHVAQLAAETVKPVDRESAMEIGSGPSFEYYRLIDGFQRVREKYAPAK